MKILVTGGAGFIGSHLVDLLVQQGHEVVVFDDLSSGHEKNLAHLPDIDFHRGSVTDFPDLLAAMAGCERVFHLAGLVSVPESISRPLLNHQVNVTGTYHVFEAARQHGIKRVVYASSAAVYGDLPELPKRESSPTAPKTPYALAKLMGEEYGQLFNQLYGMECVGLRFMNVYGPRQDPTSPYSGVLSIFCRAAIEGRPITVFGDGCQTRDFVYVSDVVAGIVAAAELKFDMGQRAVFNIGRGVETSLLDILQILQDLSPDALDIRFEPERFGDIRHSVADICCAQEVLNFFPNISLKEGLEVTLGWLKGN